MNCTQCDQRMLVTDSRVQNAGYVWRKRKCRNCGKALSTLELPQAEVTRMNGYRGKANQKIQFLVSLCREILQFHQETLPGGGAGDIIPGNDYTKEQKTDSRSRARTPEPDRQDAGQPVGDD